MSGKQFLIPNGRDHGSLDPKMTVVTENVVDLTPTVISSSGSLPRLHLLVAASLPCEGGGTRCTTPGLHFNAIINCVACVVTNAALLVFTFFNIFFGFQIKQNRTVLVTKPVLQR